MVQSSGGAERRMCLRLLTYSMWTYCEVSEKTIDCRQVRYRVVRVRGCGEESEESCWSVCSQVQERSDLWIHSLKKQDYGVDKYFYCCEKQKGLSQFLNVNVSSWPFTFLFSVGFVTLSYTRVTLSTGKTSWHRRENKGC